MREYIGENYSTSYDDSERAKEKLYNEVVNFFLEYEVFDGESIYQCDRVQEPILELVSDIAENILKFKTKWRDS